MSRSPRASLSFATKISAGLALAMIGFSGTANAQGCDDQAGGAIVGAIIGGVIGGAIGNEIADNSNDRNRGYRGYGGRGGSYGRGRGGGHYYRDQRRDDNDGEVLAGVLLGGLAGAAIGAGATDCDNNGYNRGETIVVGPNGQYRADPYGRGQVTRSGDYGWEEPQYYPAAEPYAQPQQQQQPYYDPRANSYPGTRDYPVQPQTRYPQTQGYPVRECQTVYSETRYPDGRLVREPVTLCRESGGDWQRDDSELYGY